jgi:hypothetical protein
MERGKKKRIFFIVLISVLVLISFSLFLINETNRSLTGRFIYEVSIVNLQEFLRSLITGWPLQGTNDVFDEFDDGGSEGGNPPAPFCGDGSCNGDETCDTCTEDCGDCPIEFCGDGSCNGGEDCSSCSEDCGTCPPPNDEGGGGSSSDEKNTPLVNDTFEAEIIEEPENNETSGDELTEGGGEESSSKVTEEAPKKVVEISKTILEEKSGGEEKVASLIRGEKSVSGVGNNGEETNEVSCIQRITCGKWSKCSYSRVEDVFSDRVKTIGYERRICKDESRCINDYLEERTCVPPEVEVVRTAEGVSIKEGEEVVADIRIDEGKLIIDL